MIRHVEVTRNCPQRLWQNQTVHLGYYLRNRRRSSCLAIQIEEVAPSGIQGAKGYCLNLPPRSVFRAGGRFVARLRGRMKLNGMAVMTSFPFGLVLVSRYIDQPADIVVWPAMGRLKRRLLRRGAVESSTAAPSPATGGQDEFFGLREYREGDSPRWISWRRSANRRVPLVREMARPLPEMLWVIVDTQLADPSEQTRDGREKIIRFAGTLINHAFNRGYQVGIAIACGDKIRILRPDASSARRAELLDALADVDDATQLPLENTISSLDAGQLRHAQVIVASADRAHLAAAPLSALRRYCSHLTVIGPDELDGVFQDDRLSIPTPQEQD